MIRTKSIRIWTLLTHAFIIIGMGHGGATLGILEALFIVYLFSNAGPAKAGHVYDFTMPLVAILSLAGQLAIMVSFYVKTRTAELTLHLSGLFFLWLSLLLYAYGIRNDAYAHLAVVSCLPFLYFTIRTFVGGHFNNLWQRMLDKL